MSIENVLHASWQAPAKVRTLITRADSFFSGEDAIDVELKNSFGFNVATHVGDSKERVLSIRQQIQKEIGSEEAINWLTQVHGNACLDLDAFPENKESDLLEYDACFSFHPKHVCVVSTADCLPIFVSDEQGHFVCAIHAGWQGLHKDIIPMSLQRIRESANKQAIDLAPLCAYIGPAISQKNYQVDEKFYSRFIDKNAQYQACFEPDGEGRFLADLKGIAYLQLKAEGVDHINDSGICTYEHEAFYSYRKASHHKETRCGRFASMIWLDN